MNEQINEMGEENVVSQPSPENLEIPEALRRDPEGKEFVQTDEDLGDEDTTVE